MRRLFRRVWQSNGNRDRRPDTSNKHARLRRRLVLEPLEPRRLLSARPLISEFMASNGNTLADVDGDFSDWIEIYNPDPGPLDLHGWFLTDKDDNLTKWEFPACTLQPDQYLVVFASEKDRTDPAAQLHTNFKLKADGEYLALVEPDGETVAFEYAPEYPPQFEDVSYGTGSVAEITTVLSSGAAARAIVPTDDTLGQTWIDPGFDDAGWAAGTTGVGYERETGYAGQIGLDVEPAMFGVNSSAYVRTTFDVDNAAAVDQLTLRMKYDDGFAAYLNGQEVAHRNAPMGGGDSPESGLVGYWDFDDDMDDKADEYANNSGTAADDLGVQAGGAIRFVEGISGQAAALDAAGGDALSLSAPDSLDTRLGPIYTIESWIYPTDLYSWGRFVLNWAGAGNSYHFALRDGNQVSLFHSQSNQTNRNADSASMVQLGSAGGWQHIAGVADGTHLRVYYNGVEVGTTTYDGTIHMVAQGLGIGDAPPGGSGSSLRYQGYLDDLAVWNVALTDDQILSHYQAGSQGYGLTAIGGGGGSALAWDSAATQGHDDAQALQFESIDVSAHLDALQSGQNTLAVHGLNLGAGDPDFLIVPELDTGSLAPQPLALRYFTVPTPGGPNGTGVADLGPVIRDVTEAMEQPGDADNVVITAAVAPTNLPVASATLHYRVMFGIETALPMVDDGTGGDEVAADGVLSATIPAAASDPGQMLRWYVTATDSGAHESRWPLFEDPLGSAEYLGTVVADPSTVTELPVLHRFIANTGAAETGTGTRASVYYLDEFYDNVFVRIRGGTARSWPKKAYKFKFNEGHGFRFDSELERVDEINVNTTYTDKSYVRAVLAYETHRDAGTPGPETFALRMQQNGTFFSVAHFVEQPQPVFLRRHDLDDEGALYKATQTTNGLTGSATYGMEKKYPKDGDFSDLQALIDGLALSGTAQENFVFDNVNLPAQINFMAVNVILQNIDATDKNYFIYRDTYGTGEWQMLPWDLDLTFGPNALNTDHIEAADDTPNDHSSHPFLGGLQFPFHGRKNHLFNAIFTQDRMREMFLRRLRTLMDQLLDSADQHYENRIDELVALLGPDVLLDKARWGGNAHFGSTDYTLLQATNRIKNEYLDPRRTHLFANHSIHNPGYPNNAGIPDAQAGNPSISFGALVYNPVSGNQDEEYIELFNPNPEAVDVSGWRLIGGVETTFQPGTVIPAGDVLYVSPDVAAFRGRAAGPTGGQGLFVQGYDGHLSSFGETITLVAAGGEVIDEITYQGNPSLQQLYLRITEINYNPHDANLALGEPDVDNNDFEFIELLNTNTQQTLNLENVKFTDGILFDFTGSGVTTLGAGERVLVVKDQSAFESRYGTGGNVAGEFVDSSLNNGGETIKLEDPTNSTIAQFTYDNGNGWPGRAGGKGAALEVTDTGGDYNDQDNWHSSVKYGGTPGTEPVSDFGVVVNEVLTHTDSPAVDTIELLNTTGDSVDVGGWYLSDSWGWDSNAANGDYKKFRIPDETIIPAGGYRLFDESDFNPTPQTPGPNHFALDSDHGDDVWLMKADAAGNLTHFGDHVEFGAAANGQALGRWPNGTGGMYPMIEPTSGGPNSGPQLGLVVITEVHYNPGTAANADDLEFVEIYNTTGQAVDLTHWRLRKGVDFDFAGGTMLPGNSTMVIVPFDPADVDKLADFQAEYNAQGLIAGGYADQLGNGGERVQLLRPDAESPAGSGFYPGLLEDEISYDDNDLWPVEADGSGDSLHRLGSNRFPNDPDSWTTAVPTPGAVTMTPEVSGCHVFYNNSAFDGNDPDPNAADDGAIATDKEALRPGGTASFVNYTSYSRGINGIMVDIADPPTTPTADDFAFGVGNNDTPSGWSPGPDPITVTVRDGAGIGNSDRVTILWADAAIRRQWLQVTVLLTNEEFYFGNAVAEGGNSLGNAKVTTTDLLLARNNPRNFTTPAEIDFKYDYNRDARVNATDVLLARNNQTNFLTTLRLIEVPDTVIAGQGEQSPVPASVSGDPPRPATAPEALPARLAWLYEYEQISVQKRPSGKPDPAREAVDKLLATSWP